jgi:hypothetical protein
VNSKLTALFIIFFQEADLPARRAEKKLSSKKLSALEKLKKIRAGEKVRRFYLYF